MPVSNKALVLNTNIRKKLQKTETDRYNTERSHTIYALRLQQRLINCLDLISQKLTDELFTCSPTDRQTDRQRQHAQDKTDAARTAWRQKTTYQVCYIATHQCTQDACLPTHRRSTSCTQLQLVLSHGTQLRIQSTQQQQLKA